MRLQGHRLSAARIAIALAWLVCVGVFASRAAAQSRGDVTGYREAIAEALQEYSAQNYPEARTPFARAHELYPNARTFRGLGVVSFELRRYSDCVVFLRQALASDRKPLDAGMRAESEQLLARALAFVAQIEIRVEPTSAHVAIDGATAVPLAERPFLLDVGRHELEVQAPGHAPQRRLLTVIGGEHEIWQVALPSASPTVAAAMNQSPAEQRTVDCPAGFSCGPDADFLGVRFKTICLSNSQ